MATALSPRSWEVYDKERGGLIFMVRPDFCKNSGHCTTCVTTLTTSYCLVLITGHPSCSNRHKTAADKSSWWHP